VAADGAILLQKETHADATVNGASFAQRRHRRPLPPRRHPHCRDGSGAFRGRPDMVSPAAVVVDVGVNRVDDPPR